MLNAEDNALLTRVGPGTRMGSLLRQYWQPVLYTAELPTPDSPPLRVRILGEDLVAFRDTAGRVGLVGAKCPHRGADLFFGRNEEHGLRCVYHGWKFDADGKCVDMPSEPAGSTFRNKLPRAGYPCRERGGVIWAWMGPGDAPELPDLEWAQVPESHRYATKRYHECNWAQALEGDLDSSHVGVLHSAIDKSVLGFGQSAERNYNYMGKYRSPRMDAEETDFGLWVAARRPDKEQRYYWRATALVLPFYAIIPPRGEGPIHVNVWQPIDDHNTMVWSIQYHGARPLSEEERATLGSGLYEHYGPEDRLPATSEAGSLWRSRPNRANDFLIDREAQCTQNFTGLRGFWRQDRAVVESMGTICDRSKEHLGTTDVGIIRFRRLMLRAAADLAASGKRPPGVDPATHRIRSVAAILPESVAWQEAVKELCVARPGEWTNAP
jgi:phthalate 4,5-dioxygenase oxygenase subunit